MEAASPSARETEPTTENKGGGRTALAAKSEDQAVPEPETPARLSLFARLKNRWASFHPSSTQNSGEGISDTLPPAAIRRPDLNAEEVDPQAQTQVEAGRLKRLLQRLNPRRKPVTAEAEALSRNEENNIQESKRDGHQGDRSSAHPPETEQAAETENATVSPLGRFARIHQALRKKRIWIPASVLMLAVISASITLGLRAPAHKKPAPIKAAKAKATPSVATTPSPPTPVSETPVSEKKADPAFEIVGHMNAETDAGVDESDCVIKDKASVSENLKKCIARFNSTTHKPTLSAKKP